MRRIDEDDFEYCDECGSALSSEETGTCPVCGEPLGDDTADEPDAAAVHGAQRAAWWGA